jgi:hypothetical protein
LGQQLLARIEQETLATFAFGLPSVLAGPDLAHLQQIVPRGHRHPLPKQQGTALLRGRSGEHSLQDRQPIQIEAQERWQAGTHTDTLWAMRVKHC